MLLAKLGTDASDTVTTTNATNVLIIINRLLLNLVALEPMKAFVRGLGLAYAFFFI